MKALLPTQMWVTHDFQIRIRESDLEKLRWQHVTTFTLDGAAQDAPPNAIKAGATEWMANFQDKSLSIGWDWYLDDANQIHSMEVVAPRSNILIIDAKGYDCPAEESTAILLSFIKQQFFWQGVVLSELINGIEDLSSAVEIPMEFHQGKPH